MNNARILIVEDEAIVARDLRGRLTKLGYTPVGATARGDQAVVLAEQLRPDVVLMDIQLQGAMDGVEAAAVIRARFHLPVIFATANADDAMLNRALVTEPFGYIVKPFQDRELRAVIEMAVYKNRRDRESRDNEANQAAIVAASLDGIITTDAEGRITEFSPAAEQVFGHARADVLSKLLPELLLPEATRENYQREVAQCPASNNGVVVGRRLELTARRADGAEIPVELAISRAERENQPIVIGLWRDLSAIKRAEQQLLQAQRMQLVGQLAGGIAHDFNNLLTIINGHTEALFTSLRADFRACMRIQEIARAGDRAAGLTRQLLAFSRQQIFKSRLLSLNDLVTDFQRVLGRLISENIQLTTNLSPNLGQVKADPNQIEQVLVNLTVNARDAMPTGGHLSIETANVELDEVYARSHPEAKPGHYAVLAVSDTGCGMDKETQARIFEPFFTTKAHGKGTGLGLSTAYGIVKQSGGYIYVYSEVGKGTTFKVYVPLVADLPVAALPPRSTPASIGHETVLLVEDEDGVRLLLRSTLEDHGYAVLEAAHGADALAVAEAFDQPIDLLLTDVVMPGMGGRELAQRFADLRPDTKVVFMSGYTDDMVIRHGVLEAEVEFIQKPYTMRALLQKVRAVLDQEVSSDGQRKAREPVGVTS